jgi:hypothetical protein
MEAAKQVKEEIVKLEGWHLKSAEYERNEWVVNAPEGAKVEHAKKPEFWRSVAAKLKPFDRIELRADDGTWIAELIVIYSERNWAKVDILNHYKLCDSDMPESAVDYDVQWKGPQKKWIVLRKSDNATLKEGIQTKDEAIMWMKEHDKVVN